MIIISRAFPSGLFGYWKTDAVNRADWTAASITARTGFLATNPVKTTDTCYTAEQVIANGWVPDVVTVEMNFPAAAPPPKPKAKVKTRVYNKADSRKYVVEDI